MIRCHLRVVSVLRIVDPLSLANCFGTPNCGPLSPTSCIGTPELWSVVT